MAKNIDAGELREQIEQLDALTEELFTRALGENLVDEDPVETAAFRSPDLVERSYAAIRLLLQQTQQRIERRDGESNKAWQHRAQYFLNRAGQERRILERVRDGLRAQQGIESAAPNPRARAARELQRRHPVEYLDLVRKHERAIIEERRAARAAQKEARRRPAAR